MLKYIVQGLESSLAFIVIGWYLKIPYKPLVSLKLVKVTMSIFYKCLRFDVDYTGLGVTCELFDSTYWGYGVSIEFFKNEWDI